MRVKEAIQQACRDGNTVTFKPWDENMHVIVRCTTNNEHGGQTISKNEIVMYSNNYYEHILGDKINELSEKVNKEK